MPAEQEQFHQNVLDVLEAVMFENWIRFYFLAEEEGSGKDGEEAKLCVAIPEKGMAKIAELYPRLAAIAAHVNGREANFENSRKAVCEYVLGELDGTTMARGTAASILDSHSFQVAMQLFNIWVQAYEEKLDERFLDFGAWKTLFAQWRASEQGREIEAKLDMGAPTMQQPGSVQ